MSPGEDGDHWGCRLEFHLTGPAEQPDMSKWVTQPAFRLTGWRKLFAGHKPRFANLCFPAINGSFPQADRTGLVAAHNRSASSLWRSSLNL